jgi:tryptophan-rich sensory protein
VAKEVMKMLSNHRKALLLFFSLLFCYGVEWTASFFTQSSIETWYPSLQKPFWNPPNLAFPIVWTILYTMIGVSFWKILCKPKAYRLSVFLAFSIQIFLNFTWSFSFFYLQSPSMGLFNIILLLMAIIWNTKVFWLYSKIAAKLLIPYLLWVGYATSLNLAIWYLN